jgi:hypothetical protein
MTVVEETRHTCGVLETRKFLGADKNQESTVERLVGFCGKCPF